MLAEIEVELVELIRNSALARCLRQVGTLPDLAGNTLVSRFASDAPAVYVSPEPLQVSDGVMTVNFGVACVARNARGHEDARRGDGQTIGLYQIVEQLAALLDNGRTASIAWTVSGVSFMRDGLLFDSGLTVAEISASGRVTLPAAIDESLLADFKTFHADYDVDPHQPQTEHVKWIKEPSDHSSSRPELTDNLQVQP